MVHHSFERRLLRVPVDQNSHASVWAPEKQELLSEFLTSVANTPCKVRVLRLFLWQRGLYLSSISIAQRLGCSPFEVRRAVRELHHAGVLNYSARFGNGDLCSLRRHTLEPDKLQQVELLEFALCRQPNAVWGHFSSPAGSGTHAIDSH